ncbi:MAG: hypothetical protein PUC82_01885 [bacterium]|nr:hypothetical protein [bacterium]
MNDTVAELRKNHLMNYKNALMENVKNNTNVLVDEDIMSLLKKPPLDSMDLIKTKFLDMAKKNKVILNTENLNGMIIQYRDDLIKVCPKLKEIRINSLNSKIEEFKLNDDLDVFKLAKKDFIVINKELKKAIKEHIKKYIDEDIINKLDCLFLDDVDIEKKEKIILEVSKFINSSYQKQLLENIDFKILVKDTILMNGVKEQNERYLFTLNNSRIFSDL